MDTMTIAGPDDASIASSSKYTRNIPRAKYDRLFVVTYGRSGSTLLQGILNALPGYLIRGENYDILGEIQKLYEKLPRYADLQTGDAGRQVPATTATHPFYGFERFCDENLAVAFRRFCDFMLTNDSRRSQLRCLGFKEIRYIPNNVSEKVDFLRTLYPGCAVIYNVRKPEDVVASEFQRNKPPAYIKRFNAVLADLDSVDPHSFLVKYEDIVAGTGTMRGLYTFLDESFDQKRYEAVLQRKHSYHDLKKGSIHSNVPSAVRVAKKLQGIELFIVDKLVSEGQTTQIDGFMVESAGSANKRFARLVDSFHRSIDFSAEYKLPSPKLGKKIGSGAAEQARFQLRFGRPDAEELRFFFENGELALTIPAGRPL